MTDLARSIPDQSAHAVRWVMAHLTPFAPGCAARPIWDAARWLHLGDVAPREAMRQLLERLCRRADTVSVRMMKMGDLGVFPTDASTGGYPLAFVVEGLTEAEARAALADLAWPQPRGVAA